VSEQGVVKFFNIEKRYGFIERENGGSDVFVHANDVIYGALPLYSGQRVEFVEVKDAKRDNRTHAGQDAHAGAWRISSRT
jgi:CspA family cold shock protein